MMFRGKEIMNEKEVMEKFKLSGDDLHRLHSRGFPYTVVNGVKQYILKDVYNYIENMLRGFSNN
jgi:hypothetical protein